MASSSTQKTKPAKQGTQKSAKTTIAIGKKKSKGFTDEERAAMKERAQELKGGSAPRRARGQGERGKRRAREDRRDAGNGSRHPAAGARRFLTCQHRTAASRDLR
jgi:hypothetical protein